MSTSSRQPQRGSRSRWILFVLLVFMGLFTGARPVQAGGEAPAAAGPGSSAIGCAAPLTAVAAVGGLDSLPLAESWFFKSMRYILGSQRRMVQFVVVGMCIGLYIMMRNKIV